MLLIPALPMFVKQGRKNGDATEPDLKSLSHCNKVVTDCSRQDFSPWIIQQHRFWLLDYNERKCGIHSFSQQQVHLSLSREQLESPDAHCLFLPHSQSAIIHTYLFNPLPLLKCFRSIITTLPHHHIITRTN